MGLYGRLYDYVIHVALLARVSLITVLSRASANPWARAHPPIWPFCGLWGPPCNRPPCKILAWWWLESSQFEFTQTVPTSFRRHYIRQQSLHTPVVASSAAFFACSTKFAYCKRRTHGEALATRLQVGPFSSRIQLSLLSRWPRLPKKGSTGKGTTRVNSVAPVSYLWIRGGRLHGHSWTIQHLLRVRAHPRFFGLQLRAPMGDCTGHSVLSSSAPGYKGKRLSRDCKGDTQCILRDVTSSYNPAVHFIAWWKVLLIAVQFRYNTRISLHYK